MNHASPTITASIIKLRLDIARARGMDASRVLETVGLTEAFLTHPFARVTLEQDRAVWRELVRLSGDTTLALKFGNQIQLSGLGILGYILMNTPTIAQALQMFVRYERLVANVHRASLLETDDSVVFVFGYEGIPDEPEERYVADWVMASVKIIIDSLIGKSIGSLLKAVHFKYDCPPELDSLSIYREIFGDVVLRFGCPDTRCIFSPRLRTTPILGANPHLLEMFEAQGQALIQKYYRENWSDLVRKGIVRILQGDLPTLNEIAAELTVSPRNLQLKLQQENTSFQDLLNEVRRDMAIECLRKQNLNKTEIAYLLGFSNASSFSRTFKKWTGQSPSTFQKAIVP